MTTEYGRLEAHRPAGAYQGAQLAIGALWGKIGELEDQIAAYLIPHPVGSLCRVDSVGWALALTERGLELVSGLIEQGEIVDPTSRHDMGLDWVDIEEDQLEEHVARLSDAVARLERGELRISRAPAAEEREERLRAAVLENDASATFVVVTSIDQARIYVGPVAATVENGFAQRIGRGVYAIHDLAPPASELGELVEVKYREDKAPSVSGVATSALER